MVKRFTLSLFLLGNVLFSFSKSSFQLVEIDPSGFNGPGAKVNAANFRFDNSDYLVVQPKNNSPLYLEENNVDIQSYLGDGFYLVSLPASKENILQKLQTNKIGYILPETKIDETLKTASSSSAVTILYAPAVDETALNTICEKSGISMIHKDKKNHHFTAYADLQQIEQLAQYPFVFYITKFYEKKNPLLYESSILLGANQVQEVQPYGFNLKGEGVNVGIWDDGAVGTHFDLPPNRNFVVDKSYSFPQAQVHTTYVGGCVGGGGNYFGILKGFAPRCNMYYWDVLNDIVQEVVDGKSMYGVDISNHSYNFGTTTCAESGSYIPESADLDRVIYDHPTVLPVIAVGNSGSTCAVRDTFSSVDIGFQGCKNVITVGWIFSDNNIVGNSGRGPTTDGRLKPELVAKGFGVQTTAPNNGFNVTYGSSFASPQVAGISALLHQKYKQQFGTLPNGALVKAILCNTARDLGNPGPDYTFGFGKPDVYRAVNSVDKNFFYEDNAAQGLFNTHTISFPSNNISKLSVTLCWTDKEGSPVALQSLVNNLDLKVVTPGGDTILPWKLNPDQYKKPALRGIDNLNNIEQVTIDNAVAGTYTIVVKGTEIPYGPQGFAVAYYGQERQIEITHPNGGEVIDGNGSANYIRWNLNGVPDSLADIELSSDSGSTWLTVAHNYQLSKQLYNWTVPAIVSSKCLMRITSGSNVDVSASTFTIASQLNYPLINHTVCDRSIKINWPALTGATSYKIYLFVDSVWTLAGQTSLLTFTINKLTNGKTYLYSLTNIVNGVESNHSFSNIFTPKSNVCTTLNDVGVYSVYKPIGGRKFTSMALTATEKLSFIIKNYGTATQNSISVSYKINGGSTRTAALTDIVTANDTSIMKFAVNEDLSVVGNYNVVAWTSLAGDNNTQNDTLVYTIRNLANDPLVLPFLEGFETSNTELSYATFGINGLDYADYYPEDGGRLRTNEGSVFAKTGKKAIALDNYSSTIKRNELIFTYNLTNYKDSVVFLDFNYLSMNEPDGRDTLFVRGSDTKPWIPIYDLFVNRGDPGSYKLVNELNLYQRLKVENGQDFTSSTQVKIVQTGTKMTNTPYGDGGYAFDDFKLYVAGRDVSVVDVSVNKINCSKSFAPLPITVKVLNNSSQTITSLPVFYQVDNNVPVSEVITGPISADDTASYTFTTLFDNSNPGLYSISVWAQNPGDNYRPNDTFATVNVIVMQTVDSFPYYNDFETDNGHLFSEGINNSWAWGSPAKYYLNDAAQENKAWTTGINKGYNFNEDSYLYMGCLDFSNLTTDPLISFNFFSIMQTQSDSAFVEYSTDGTDWKRLGCYNCGLNWYNGYHNKPYWDQIIFPWQVAHTIVPLGSLTDSSNFMYRVHLLSDDFAVAEGIGIDDVHILKDYQEMAGKDSAYTVQASTGDGWIQFIRNGKLVAELYDDHKNLGNITLGLEADDTKHKEFGNENIFPRNWVMKPQNSIVGNYKVRLYVLNSEYTNYVLNEDSINRMGDIGLLRYIGLNTNLDIIDNHVRAYYKYYSPDEIQFYPYLNGYYVEFNTDTLGEFYLISTRQDADAIQNINVIGFSAQKINDDVYLEWTTTHEDNSKEFIIQYSFDAATFIDVDTIPAGGFSENLTLYNYLHQLNATSGIYYYRIKMVENNNNYSYSLIDSVNFTPNVGVKQNVTDIRAYISDYDIVVEMKSKLHMPSTIRVYNSLGQLQYSEKMQLTNGINPLGIQDFLHWSNGAYYLQILTDEHNYYSKLMKQ